jgi:hypothetical protein
VGAELFQADRTKLIVTFHNFVNALKNSTYLYVLLTLILVKVMSAVPENYCLRRVWNFRYTLELQTFCYHCVVSVMLLLDKNVCRDIPQWLYRTGNSKAVCMPVSMKVFMTNIFTFPCLLKFILCRWLRYVVLPDELNFHLLWSSGYPYFKWNFCWTL